MRTLVYCTVLRMGKEKREKSPKRKKKTHSPSSSSKVKICESCREETPRGRSCMLCGSTWCSDCSKNNLFKPCPEISDRTLSKTVERVLDKYKSKLTDSRDGLRYCVYCYAKRKSLHCDLSICIGYTKDKISQNPTLRELILKKQSKKKGKKLKLVDKLEK